MEFLANYWWIFLILSIVGSILGFILLMAGYFGLSSKTRNDSLSMIMGIILWIIGVISAPLFFIGVIIAIIQFVKG